MMWFAYAMVWLATAAATGVGLYYTKDPNCLWAMVFPCFVQLSANRDKKKVA